MHEGASGSRHGAQEVAAKRLAAQVICSVLIDTPPDLCYFTPLDVKVVGRENF